MFHHDQAPVWMTALSLGLLPALAVWYISTWEDAWAWLLRGCELSGGWEVVRGTGRGAPLVKVCCKKVS